VATAFQSDAFQNNAFQIITAPGLSYAVEAELSGVGGGWTDLTGDMVKGLSLSYGIRGSGPDDRVAGTGTLQFRLLNSPRNSGGLTGYYSPFNANKRSGWEIGIRVRLRLTLDGVTSTKFIGWLDNAAAMPGQFGRREVFCTVVDWIGWAARSTLGGVATLTNTTADAVITALSNATPVQPDSLSLDTGSDTYPYALDTARGEPVAAELERVTMSEFGLTYVRAGVLYFENRTARLTASPSLVLTDQEPGTGEENFRALSVDSGRETVRNRIRVTLAPRTVDGSNVVLFSLPNKPQIQPGAANALTFDAPYTDPTNRAARVGGMSMVTPVATTDYTMNTLENGSGTNLTASFAVSVTYGADHATVTIQNNHATLAGYVTLMQLRGLGLYTYEEVTVDVQDSTSISSYGEMELGFEMPYQSSLVVAQSIAEYVLNAWKNPNNGQVTVSFTASTDGLLDALVNLDIGSPIAVYETVTGVNSAYWINGVDVRWDSRDIASVTWYLARGETQTYWTIDVSQLDNDAVVAPG
jgi:hypothetical protein